ncbi:FHA domain-containing protein [Deferrisoma sp.]
MALVFVCPSCRTALKVDPAKLPKQPVRYRCKRCGEVSVVQDHLHERPPAAPPPPPEPTPDGTVYHHVSDLAQMGMPRAAYRLVVEVEPQDGRRSTRTFDDTRITVGRGDATVRVNDPLVSRIHLEIERVKDRVIVKDLGSTNGTFVNDRAATAEFVGEGDVVRIGNTKLRVRVEMAG